MDSHYIMSSLDVRKHSQQKTISLAINYLRKVWLLQKLQKKITVSGSMAACDGYMKKIKFHRL